MAEAFVKGTLPPRFFLTLWLMRFLACSLGQPNVVTSFQWSPIFSRMGYLICNIVSAVLVTRKNKIAKRNGNNQIDSPDAVDVDVAQNEQIVENNSQNK